MIWFLSFLLGAVVAQYFLSQRRKRLQGLDYAKYLEEPQTIADIFLPIPTDDRWSDHLEENDNWYGAILEGVYVMAWKRGNDTPLKYHELSTDGISIKAEECEEATACQIRKYVNTVLEFVRTRNIEARLRLAALRSEERLLR